MQLSIFIFPLHNDDEQNLVSKKQTKLRQKLAVLKSQRKCISFRLSYLNSKFATLSGLLQEWSKRAKLNEEELQRTSQEDSTALARSS